jgi:Helitron helicase-like domain at N-terminus
VRTTQCDYYSHRFHVKGNNDFNILHRSGRAFQEYIVDPWAQIEQGRLGYIADHQNNIRYDLYRKVVDTAANGTDLHKVRNPVILLFQSRWRTTSNVADVPRRHGPWLSFVHEEIQIFSLL